MNCPVCGKEMEKGRVTAGGWPIHWVPEDKSTVAATAFASFRDGFIIISERSFSTKGVPASIGHTCRKVLVDY